MAAYTAGYMTHATCRLNAKNRVRSGTLRSVIEHGLPLPLRFRRGFKKRIEKRQREVKQLVTVTAAGVRWVGVSTTCGRGRAWSLKVDHSGQPHACPVSAPIHTSQPSLPDSPTSVHSTRTELNPIGALEYIC